MLSPLFLFLSGSFPIQIILLLKIDKSVGKYYLVKIIDAAFKVHPTIKKLFQILMKSDQWKF